jgi:hypothetical protein
MTDDIEVRIKERAFQIWIEEGRPQGRDRENWEKAKAEIVAEDKHGFIGQRSDPLSNPFDSTKRDGGKK